MDTMNIIILTALFAGVTIAWIVNIHLSREIARMKELGFILNGKEYRLDASRDDGSNEQVLRQMFRDMANGLQATFNVGEKEYSIRFGEGNDEANVQTLRDILREINKPIEFTVAGEKYLFYFDDTENRNEETMKQLCMHVADIQGQQIYNAGLNDGFRKAAAEFQKELDDAATQDNQAAKLMKIGMDLGFNQAMSSIDKVDFDEVLKH